MSAGFFFSKVTLVQHQHALSSTVLYNVDMKKLSLIASFGALCLLVGCGEDTGRVTKVQPKPPPPAAEKVPGPDDAFNANRKLQSTTEAPPTAPGKKKKS